MKKIYLLSLAAILSVAVVLVSCHKEDETKPEPEPEPNKEEPQKEEPKIQYDSSEVFSLITKSSYKFFNEEKHSPLSGDTACRCFSYPIAIASNVTLYSPIEIKVLDTLTYTYRYQIARFSVTNAAGENMSEGCTLNETESNITYLTHKNLATNTEYTAATTVTLAQLVNGEWKPVIYRESPIEYSCSIKFTTGKLPENKIESGDILYQYPIDRQRYYLPEEYKLGYIMMSYTYSKIFDGVPAENLKVVISSVSDETQPRQTTSFSYKECHDVDRQVAEINYSLENITFLPQAIYRFDFLCGEDTIYYMHLGTSKHPDFKSKIANHDFSSGKVLQTISTSQSHDRTMLSELWQNVSLDESFDRYETELNGFAYVGLIRMDLDLENCEWYLNSYYKLFYDNYTIYHNTPENQYCNIPPSNAMGMSFVEGDRLLADDEINSKAINQWENNKGFGGICCYVQTVMQLDFADKWSNFSRDNSELESKFTYAYYEKNDVTHFFYTHGDYPFSISYCLPGKNIVTYTERHILQYTNE